METSKQTPPSSNNTALDTLVVQSLVLWEEQKSLLIGAVGVILLAALAVPGYLYFQQQQAETADTMLGEILPVYEQGRYQAAIDGTGDRPSLVAIAEDYSGTPAGNLAAFYAGNALYQMEEYDRALTFYESFEKQENYIGASAYAAEAAIYENMGDFATAGDRYVQAAEQFESEFSTPQYLLSAGRAYEEAEQFDDAITQYQRVTDDYEDAPQAALATRNLARVRAKQG